MTTGISLLLVLALSLAIVVTVLIGRSAGVVAAADNSSVWVNSLTYGSAGGGFYWDFTSGTVWTAERGWHTYSPLSPSPTSTLWVNYLAYGSVGGGFYLDPLSGQVWTAERGWHLFSAREDDRPQPTEPAGSVPPRAYPLHTAITATVFWIGEPVGNGSSEDNSRSAWDDDWEAHYGGVDDPEVRNGYFPRRFVPRENPFYFDLPYDDFTDGGNRRPNAALVVPWANRQHWGVTDSMLKNRWVRFARGTSVCYGQWEDAGPYVYDDSAYVFGTDDSRPQNRKARNAGLDVSPALRDCLGFHGSNNAENSVDWRFVEQEEVPVGPWREIVTTSQVRWRP